MYLFPQGVQTGFCFWKGMINLAVRETKVSRSGFLFPGRSRKSALLVCGFPLFFLMPPILHLHLNVCQFCRWQPVAMFGPDTWEWMLLSNVNFSLSRTTRSNFASRPRFKLRNRAGLRSAICVLVRSNCRICDRLIARLRAGFSQLKCHPVGQSLDTPTINE